ncbi:hypothetical protein [Mycobacterium sp. GA-1841]|uniref:hypothetical protein n=1 Tax=Mycobacterium sp. GA-1841 TaxID=1834154 RepID=UPI0011156975|nr:hypothetical protein [Mycobacterium sp. GA-1841]
MAFQQMTSIKICVAAASAATLAAIFCDIHDLAPSADSLPNSECEGATYCVTGGDRWLPNGADQLARRDIRAALPLSSRSFCDHPNVPL